MTFGEIKIKLAAFTCSLSADAPCLWQEKRVIIIIIIIMIIQIVSFFVIFWTCPGGQGLFGVGDNVDVVV